MCLTNTYKKNYKKNKKKADTQYATNKNHTCSVMNFYCKKKYVILL